MIDLLSTGLPQTFNLFKKKKNLPAKYNKAQYACKHPFKHHTFLFKIIIDLEEAAKIEQRNRTHVLHPTTPPPVSTVVTSYITIKLYHKRKVRKLTSGYP